MSNSQVTSIIYDLRLENWISASMSALAMFEYVTTLDQEVASAWKRRRSGASLLFFAVRYTMLASAIVNTFGFARLNTKECAAFFVSNASLVFLEAILTAAFSALRVYALSGGSVKLSAVGFLLQLSPFFVNVYHYAESTFTVDPLFGCVEMHTFSPRTVRILSLASRIPLTIGDVFVVIVTWIKSFQQVRMQHSIGVHLPLSTLLLRDGTVYFLFLLVMNVLQASPITSSHAGNIIGVLNRSLPIILVNRFMLNLRQLSDSETRSAGHILTISTPMFQMSLDIAGNMGKPLEHGWETREVDAAEVERAAPEDEDLGLQAEEVQQNVGDIGLEIEETWEEVAQAGSSRIQPAYNR